MAKTTTVRIRAADKRRLDALCHHTKRGKSDMLALLIEREYQALRPSNTKRKVG